MSIRAEVLSLLGEIRKSRSVLGRIRRFYDERFLRDTRAEETSETAIVLAEILGNYYTCAESIFFRISQHFESNLSSTEWHKDLLRKMRIDIPKIRPAVISDDTYGHLDELLRFRHFRRYYLEFEYDWNRLKLVEAAFLAARDRLEDELDVYERFLDRLSEEV